MVPKYTAPKLSPEQMEERRKWALHHLSNAWEAHIDVDEKWFYTATRKRKTKVDPQWAAEGGPGRRPCPSKRHIPKVMFMAAVAKLNPQQGLDGRNGCFRCSVPDVTKRKSKNRDKGVPYERDVTVDAEFFEGISFHFESVRHPRGGSLLERLGMGENSCVRRKRSASVNREDERGRDLSPSGWDTPPEKIFGWPESFSSTTFALHFSTLSTLLF